MLSRFSRSIGPFLCEIVSFLRDSLAFADCPGTYMPGLPVPPLRRYLRCCMRRQLGQLIRLYRNRTCLFKDRLKLHSLRTYRACSVHHRTSIGGRKDSPCACASVIEVTWFLKGTPDGRFHAVWRVTSLARVFWAERISGTSMTLRP